MGIATVYPENQAAGIAARGAGTRMCEVAESEGYSNDICAYARVSLAYAKLKSCPEQDVAMPDVLLCCSNICLSLFFSLCFILSFLLSSRSFYFRTISHEQIRFCNT